MNKKIILVSLFNGLGGARLATDAVDNLNVVRCYTSEVDKYAIQVCDHNYPQDVEFKLGDVTKINFVKLKQEIQEEFGDTEILLVGGSPCQGFSMAGKMKGSSTACGIDVVNYEQYIDLKEKEFKFNGQSYLFWEYVRARKELNPKYFLLENVRITKKWLPMFNEAMGVEPTRINSSLLSAQNRDRYYWNNFGDIQQPDDERKHLVIRDILEDNIYHQPVSDKRHSIIEKNLGHKIKDDTVLIGSSQKNAYIGVSKSSTLSAAMGLGGGQTPMIVVRPCKTREFKEYSVCHHAATATDIKGNESIKRVYSESGKSHAVTTCGVGHREPKILIEKDWNPIWTKNYIQWDLTGKGHKSQDQRAFYADGKHGTVPAIGTSSKVKVVVDKIKNVNTSSNVFLNEKNIKFMNSIWGKDTRWRKMKNPIDGKAGTVCATMCKGLPRGVIVTDSKIQEKIYKNGICDIQDFNKNKASYRKLTPLECARLQTIPSSFELFFTNDKNKQAVSNSQIYKMIGNGFTIDVISYILGHIGVCNENK